MGVVQQFVVKTLGSELTNHIMNRAKGRSVYWAGGERNKKDNIFGSGEVRTRADLRPLGFNCLKSNALDQLGHATDHRGRCL